MSEIYSKNDPLENKDGKVQDKRVPLRPCSIVTPEVIAALRDGDHDAFELLYVTFRKPLRGFLTKLSGSQETADEVIQEVFAQIWENRQRLDASRNIKSYIFTASKRTIMRHIFKSDKFDGLPDELTEQTPSEVKTDEQIEARELQLLIEITVNNMPPLRRKVIEYSREGLSNKEIAEKLNISDENVRINLYRARKDIQELIAFIIYFLVA